MVLVGMLLLGLLLPQCDDSIAMACSFWHGSMALLVPVVADAHMLLLSDFRGCIAD